MAHFYLDNDLSPKLVAWLQGIGHDATHTRWIGRRYAADDEQLVYAMRNGWPIVSHNREDYLLLHRAWHNFPPAWGHAPAPPHAGIILVAQTSPADAFAALQLFLGKQPALPLPNQLYWWDGTGGWLHLPDTVGASWQAV